MSKANGVEIVKCKRLSKKVILMKLNIKPFCGIILSVVMFAF